MIRWMSQHPILKPVPGGAFEVDINGVLSAAATWG
jgi:hypothetical protein